MFSTAAIILIVIAAVFFLALNLFRSLFKAITITIFILMILSALIGFLVFKDAKEFGYTINHNKTTYLLQEEDEIIKTGFQAHRLNLSTFDDLSQKEIETLREEPTGKIFIINKSILNTSIEEKGILGFDIKDMLESDSPENRARAFALALATTVEEEGPLGMMLLIRDQEIIVEPKTPVVYLVTASPRQLYKQGKTLVVSQVDKNVDLVREKVSS